MKNTSSSKLKNKPIFRPSACSKRLVERPAFDQESINTAVVASRLLKVAQADINNHFLFLEVAEPLGRIGISVSPIQPFNASVLALVCRKK
jgi:hypothetical protein